VAPKNHTMHIHGIMTIGAGQSLTLTLVGFASATNLSNSSISLQFLDYPDD